MSGRQWSLESLLITALGVALFLVAVAHHGLELAALDGLVGPLLSLGLDGIPALGIIYAGYRLAATDLAVEYRRTILRWALSGGLIFMAVIGASFLIRSLEGRPITEWQFPLLLAVEVGLLSGLLSGYYNVRAQAESDRSRTVSQALEFVNSLLRHDLRNDLMTIQGYADLLSREYEEESESAEASVISQKAEEALTRIETTRTITDTVVGEPEFEAVDLVSVIEELVETAEDVYDVQIETDLPEEALVRANEGLRSVVDNLLENAIEHNDADEPQVTVDVEFDPTSETARVSVRDNGPGIPDEDKRRLLTTDAGESGAGLTIVKSLVLAYDGDLRIEDNQPRGAVFVIELPRAERQ